MTQNTKTMTAAAPQNKAAVFVDFESSFCLDSYALGASGRGVGAAEALANGWEGLESGSASGVGPCAGAGAALGEVSMSDTSDTLLPRPAKPLLVFFIWVSLQLVLQIKPILRSLDASTRDGHSASASNRCCWRRRLSPALAASRAPSRTTKVTSDNGRLASEEARTTG